MTVPALVREHRHVAAVADWAFRHGRSMSAEVAAHYRISRAAAKMAITVARRNGEPIPYVHPAHTGQGVDAGDGAVLRCACGHTVDVAAGEAARLMLIHTLQDHQRTPATGERVPRPAAA